MKWTRDRTNALVILWNGGMTSREITDAFKREGLVCSRNSVLGQLKRLRDKGVAVKSVGLSECVQRAQSARHQSYTAKLARRNLGVGAE